MSGRPDSLAAAAGIGLGLALALVSAPAGAQTDPEPMRPATTRADSLELDPVRQAPDAVTPTTAPDSVRVAGCARTAARCRRRSARLAATAVGAVPDRLS